MRRDATKADVEHVVERLRDIGAEAHVSEGQLRTVIGAVGDRAIIPQLPGEAVPAVRKAGAGIVRGDAFKPRTSPYAFQGLGEKGLQMLAEVRDELGIPFVAEVLDPRDIELVSSYADLIRIGARNMANFTLLAEVGRQPRPGMLKRGFTATIEEWLNAAEYVYKEGNHRVILCERGIRTFETQTRNTLDISAVPVVTMLSHLPGIVDPR